ncbi:MAG: hypothetical protein QM796_16490 [Chthoniobacteraceae bacterium]
MPNARYLISILVVAQLLGHAIVNLTESFLRYLITPRLSLLGAMPELRAGRFDLNAILGAILSCGLFLLVSFGLLKPIGSWGWRWITTGIPVSKDDHV